jgi:putative photosynthetic complex assembly protein
MRAAAPSSPTEVGSPEMIPRRALVVGAAALAATIAGTAWFRLAGLATRAPDAQTVARRALRFDDLPDGGIAIVDAASGRTLEVVHGEQGFLRGTLRGLVRERKRRGLTSDAPLELIARADGRLTLVDPVTDRRIDLESFGPTNAAVFARWLGPQPVRS